MTDFIEYAGAVLGPKEVRQFRNALDKPMIEFQRRVIEPQFYQPNERYYLALAVDPRVPGRNHNVAMVMRDNPEAWQALAYFTNPLSIPPAPMIEDDKVLWVAPKDRIVWGRSQVMTFEFDEDGIVFFKKQMEWCRGRNGKPLDCAMGRLFRACSQWIDFEGITVAYSGNKSFHIHIVFDTSHAKALEIRDALRSGIMAHWDRLSEVVMDVLEPGVNPDKSMREPEKFRRIPNGHRKLDEPNILGIPAGEDVPQVVIWEKFRDRAAKGEQAIFFDPMAFAVRSFAPKESKAKVALAMPESAELDFCRAEMRAIFIDGYPEFHDFVAREGSVRALFRNHAGDRVPSSYIDPEYRTVNINGSNPLGLTPSTAPRLPKPLGQMMADWRAEYDQFNSRPRTPLEHDFAMAVVDNASARAEMAKLLIRCILDEHLSFICAPEGISKTTGLFENHHRIDHGLREAGHGGAVMYAFADYKSAIEKARDFNARQTRNGFVGVVLESFDRTYQTACDRLGLRPMTVRQATASGFAGLWQAIEALQPSVLREFRRRHAEVWAEVDAATPVIFAVHAVAHNWHRSTRSRMMWARSFWSAPDADRNEMCRAETQLSLLVHDEIKAENLVAAYRSEQVEWAESIFASDPKAWSRSGSTGERIKSFDAHMATAPLPRATCFEDVQDIFGFHGHQWDSVLTLDSGEYGSIVEGPYAAALGRQWSILERSWPVEAADRCIVLTTESVPLAIVRRSSHDWAIFDLDTPHIKADVVETYPERGVKGDKLPILCSGWQQARPGLKVISNRVAHLADTMTHAGARGSNLLIGEDVMQTMTFVTPGEFEYLEALNAWTETGTMVRQRHIDEFNQTAGRNLGFRKLGNAEHFLVVNKALFRLLVGAPKTRARYQMRVIENRYQREKASRYRSQGGSYEAKVRLIALRVCLRRERANEMRQAPPGSCEDWRKAA